jgi:hypothetical protein
VAAFLVSLPCAGLVGLRDRAGRTALDYAVAEGHAGVVEAMRLRPSSVSSPINLPMAVPTAMVEATLTTVPRPASRRPAAPPDPGRAGTQARDLALALAAVP